VDGPLQCRRNQRFQSRPEKHVKLICFDHQHRLKYKSIRGYSRAWNQYGSFFEANFALVASIVVYVAVILTAMQTGLATQDLGSNDAFQSATYGFVVFSILGLIATTTILLLIFCCIFLNNIMATIPYVKRRMHRFSSLVQEKSGSASI
jgi:hypothetical protein